MALLGTTRSFTSRRGSRSYYVLRHLRPALDPRRSCLALVLKPRWPARGALRLVYFLPAVVAARGLCDHLALPVPPLWPAEPRPREARACRPSTGSPTARPSFRGSSSPTCGDSSPYFMILYLAGLQSIPAEYLRGRVDRRGLDGPALPLHHASRSCGPRFSWWSSSPSSSCRRCSPTSSSSRTAAPTARSRVLVALHLPDRLPVPQDGARVRRVNLSSCSPPWASPLVQLRVLRERGPWLARGETACPGPRGAGASCCCAGGALAAPDAHPVDGIDLAQVARPRVRAAAPVDSATAALGELPHCLDPLQLRALLRRTALSSRRPSRSSTSSSSGLAGLQPREVPLLRPARALHRHPQHPDAAASKCSWCRRS